MNQSRRLLLSQLIGEELDQRPQAPYSLEQFEGLVETVLSRDGLTEESTQDNLAAWVVRLFLKMSVHTYHRLCEPHPALPDGLEQRFLEFSLRAPPTLGDFAQNRVDPASACRRALAIHQHLGGEGSVLMLGDDDGIGIALRLLAPYRVTVADLDGRILNWVRQSDSGIETRKLDVRTPPAYLQNSFDAVSTDPTRDGLAAQFLRSAKLFLQPGGMLFWADHPDWNADYRCCLEMSEFETTEILKNWHSYPAALPRRTRAQFQADDQSRNFLKLTDNIRLWSHLHVSRSKGVRQPQV